MANRAKFDVCMSVGFGRGKTYVRTHAKTEFFFLCVNAMPDVEGSPKLEFKKFFIVFV